MPLLTCTRSDDVSDNLPPEMNQNISNVLDRLGIWNIRGPNGSNNKMMSRASMNE